MESGRLEELATHNGNTERTENMSDTRPQVVIIPALQYDKGERQWTELFVLQRELPPVGTQPWIKLNEKGEVVGLFRFIDNQWTDNFEWKDGNWIEAQKGQTA
jgi:hypothetical protein